MRSFRGLPHRFEIFLKKINLHLLMTLKATSFRSSQFALSSFKKYILDIGWSSQKR